MLIGWWEVSPAASTQHSPEQTLLSICPEKFPDIPRMAPSPPLTHLGRILRPLLCFISDCLLILHPLKLHASASPNSTFPLRSFLSHLLSGFSLDPSVIKDRFYFLCPVSNVWPIISLQRQSDFGDLPKRHTCIPPAGLALPGRPTSWPSFLPEKCSCFVF